MAEGLLFGVAQQIITKLGSQAIQEIGQWWGFKDELDKLNDTVLSIRGVLRDAEERSMESQQVKVWLGMLKEAIYDADDLLDEFSTDISQQQLMTGNSITKEVRRFFSSSNYRLDYGRKMSPKIKAIRNRLDDIAKNKRFHLETRDGERVVKTRARGTHSSLPEVVTGREKDKKKIMEFLLSTNYEENVAVISIVGIGGLGKTTLAQLIYNDNTVGIHFDQRKWACISDDFDVKLILEKLVESKNSEMEALKNRLHQQINRKRYLMVLDDVWEENRGEWSRLKDLLVGGARGSKIVITTRLKKVAEMTGSAAIYELKGLSDEESWSLFKEIALKPGQVLTPSHKSIGKEIVAKCSGVPLAIRTIGNLLYFKDSESEWLSFKNGELSRINQEENDTSSTLKLSYSYLPLHLKQCFAYCSLFPKDYQIKVERLIQLWIAQGYVNSSDPKRCLEEIGVQYFTALHWGSFFQEVKKDDFGNYTTCKMHDLMHDLATLVAGEECASSSNFEVGISNEKTRYVSLHFDRNTPCRVSPSLFKANKLRTLLLDGGITSINEGHLGEMFSNLRCLRVLGLNDTEIGGGFREIEIGTLPSSIDKLKHLRYLDLSGSEKMKTLPNSITKLQNLRVLKLNGCYKLTKLPRDMKKLVNLMHLENEGCDDLSHMPRGIGQLTSLERLSEFVVAKDSWVSKAGAGVSELHGLNKLRGSLTIRKLGRVKNGGIECKAANLKEKQHLQYLQLDWYCANEREVENEEMALEALQPHQYLKGLSVEDYRGVKSPSWLSSLTNLVEIFFDDCPNVERVPLSHQLPFLKKLRIEDLEHLEYIDTDIRGDSEGGISSLFPSLQQLRLSSCPNLKGWNKVEKLQFPCLPYLRIKYCPNFTLMPRCPSLKQLSYLGHFLKNSPAKSFEQILETAFVASESSSSSSSSSCQLECLTVMDIEDMEFLPKVLLSNLTSLQDLRIKRCSGITTLSRDDEDDATQWQGLKSLRSLELRSLGNLVSLPMGIQYLTSLCRLEISYCPNLMSLPDCMPNLSSLQKLYIDGCAQLSTRCHNDTAEDWPKIAHIPDIVIHGKNIQRNGHYQL